MPTFTPLTLQDHAFRLVVTPLDNQVTATLTDLRTGVTWPTVPLLEVEVHVVVVGRTEMVRTFRVDAVEAVNGRIHVSLGDARTETRYGLWLALVDGELAVTLPPSEVYEDRTELYRVFSVLLLPGLLRAGPDGVGILPLNTGFVFSPKGTPATADRILLYGEQARWELWPLLPICAVHNPDGGLMALARQGAADTECHVATDGAGSATLGFGASLRRRWPDPVDWGTREVRYVSLPPGVDPVLATAKRLRRHVVEDLHKPTLEARVAESPELAYTLRAYIMKLFHGMEQRGMVFGVDSTAENRATDHRTFRDVLTFAEAGANLRRLHAAGIDRIYTQSVGWNARGHDGMYPTRFPIDERLGGEAGFRDMLAAGRALGYRMSVHDNFTDAYMTSPEFDREAIMHDAYGELVKRGYWGGGINYSIWPPSVTPGKVRAAVERVMALGVQGPYYVDAILSPPDVNHQPRHRGTRGEFVDGVVRILDTAREVSGAVATEMAALPLAVAADLVVHSGGEWHLKLWQPEWGFSKLKGRRVPLWHLALHGLLMHETHGLGDGVIAETVLYGGHPRDEWSARPGIMPVLNESHIGNIKRMYDIALQRFGYLQLTEMTSYSEPEPGVRRSTFADGTEVLVDQRGGGTALIVNGERVPLSVM